MPKKSARAGRTRASNPARLVLKRPAAAKTRRAFRGSAAKKAVAKASAGRPKPRASRKRSTTATGSRASQGAAKDAALAAPFEVCGPPAKPRHRLQEGVLRAVAELCVQRPRCQFGHGAIWDSRSKRLLWVDIAAARLFRLDVKTLKCEMHDLSEYSQFVSSVVPLCSSEDPTGDKIALTLREGFAVYDCLTRNVVLNRRNPTVPESERFHCGKVDPAGRYWAGTLDINAAVSRESSLYRQNLDGSVSRKLKGLATSSGLAWTVDKKTMYHIGACKETVDSFDFEVSTGAITNRQACIVGFDERKVGLPADCALDSEGLLWVARYGGGCVGRYDPTSGKLLAEVHLPPEAGRQVTSLCFAGASLDKLYITTAHVGMDVETVEASDTPMAGCLYRVTREALQSIGAVPGQPPTGMALP